MGYNNITLFCEGAKRCGAQAGPDNPYTGAAKNEGIRKEVAAGEAATEERKKTGSNSAGEKSSVVKVKKFKGGKRR